MTTVRVFLGTLLAMTVSALAQERCLEVVGGFDGANPQSNEAIERETEHRFRVRPFNEEGSNDAYYFRFNTRVLNHCGRETDLELLIEWPALATHPDYPYDTYYYGKRGDWRWTYASVEGTTAKLHIQVPSGESYVGFYPGYSYGQLMNFMEGLDPGHYLERWVEGESHFGRKIWAVKITDAAVEEGKKKRLLITARNHPYETSGSYIVEAMIDYLRKPTIEARELREKNIFYFLPMLNPDGVALGTNQRTRDNGVNLSFGVGTDDPSATTLLDFVTKVRPALWADVHSWPHKGDDGMWCTHSWVAEGLLARMPDGTFPDYFWNVSFVKERGTAENHLWQWLIRTLDAGGVSLSMSWYRRNEPEMEEIGVKLLKSLAETLRTGPAATKQRSRP